MPYLFRPPPPARPPAADAESISARHADWRAVGLVVLGAVSYSTVIIFTRQAEGLGALSVSFFRALFAFLFTGGLLLLYRQPLNWASLKPYWKLLLVQALFMTGTATLYVFAVQNTTAANAALLVNSGPIYIALLAPLLLKEASPRYTRLSLVLIVVGVILLTGVLDQSLTHISWPGLIAGFFSGLFYSFVLLASRYQRGQVPGLVQAWVGSGLATLLLLPWGLTAERALVFDYLPVLVLLGVISYGLPSFLYFLALTRLKAQVVSTVALLEPVSGALIGILIYGEMLSLAALIGSLMVLTSIYLIAQE